MQQTKKKHFLAEYGPRGGTQICSYIRRLGPLFGVQNFEFQYLFNLFFFWGGGGAGQKKLTFLGV